MTATPPPPPAAPTPAGSSGGTNGLAITSLITGILSILICLYWFLAAPLGIVAIITGVLGKNAADVKGGRGLAMAGLITGAVGVLLALVMVILTFAGGGITNDWLCQQDPQFC